MADDLDRTVSAAVPDSIDPLGPGEPSGVTTLVERMGIVVVRAAAEQVVATMPVNGNTQPYGLLHGGASCVLAETVGSFGAALHAGPLGKIATGVEISASHHRAARSGIVTGIATAVSLGATLACYEVVITDDQQRRVCTARLTCVLRERPPGEPQPPR